MVLYIENSIKHNWDLPAFSDYKGEELKYSEAAEKIAQLHIVFDLYGIKKGDKISLVGKNSCNWSIAYLASITYGAVIIPILQDFKPNDIHHIVNHSDSRMLFVTDQIMETLDISKMQEIGLVINLADFSVKHTTKKDLIEAMNGLDGLLKKKYPSGINATAFSLPQVSNSELAVISYTSGTTGFSKGVMLSHNSLAANIRFAINNMPLVSGDKIVSFLPLAHAYGCAFEFLFPFTLGCHITFLGKTPSPQIIMQAFNEIRPRLILSVPLVIEKIFKNQVLPIISKPLMKILLVIPGINTILHKKINKKLVDVFGGNFHEVVIGGAPFNAEAEWFFRKIKFPATVGYGMTECGPLISYTSAQTFKFQSSGKKVDTLDVKIDSEDPATIAGEIMVKGDNVMLGYYKNEEATNAVIDSEGWLHTGDLGLIDKEGNIFIKGRCKTMLLGASGQNIYPEEIESIINNKFCIMESLVVEDNGKLNALIVLDKDAISANHIGQKELDHLLKHYLKDVNHELPKYMNISKFVIHSEEFEKTPKRSIKRYLYTKE